MEELLEMIMLVLMAILVLMIFITIIYKLVCLIHKEYTKQRKGGTPRRMNDENRLDKLENDLNELMQEFRLSKLKDIEDYEFEILDYETTIMKGYKHILEVVPSLIKTKELNESVVKYDNHPYVKLPNNGYETDYYLYERKYN